MSNILTTLKNTPRKPYIYKVTNRGTGRYYIGSQCRGKIIGMNYFTSSTNKEFREGFKNHGKKYKITIIKSFIDPKECVRVENYIIRNYMQLKDGLCLNKFYCCNGEKIFSTVGIPSSKKGVPRPEETRQKISTSKKGHPSPKKGIHLSRETRQKISTSKKGIPFSEETRKKMRLSSKSRIKISIEGTVFGSIREASKYYNISTTTVRYWVKKNQHNAFYIEK